MYYFFSIIFIHLLLIKSNVFSVTKDEVLKFYTQYYQRNAYNETNWNAVTYAIEYGYDEIAEHLLLKGEIFDTPYWQMNQDRSFRYQKHPLLTAIRNTKHRLVELMLGLGCNLDNALEQNDSMTGCPFCQKNAWMIAIENTDNLIILELLASGRANINKSQRVGNPCRERTVEVTPLSYAIERKNLTAVQLLIEHGADVEGSGALIKAITTNYGEGVRLLCKRQI